MARKPVELTTDPRVVAAIMVGIVILVIVLYMTG
jgi:hypothetical protein